MGPTGVHDDNESLHKGHSPWLPGNPSTDTLGATSTLRNSPGETSHASPAAPMHATHTFNNTSSLTLEEDPANFRRFCLTIDLRSFAAGRRMPLNLTSVYLQLTLPQELIGIITADGVRMPSGVAPLRTHPPVDVNRGCEAALSNSYAAIEFSAGLMALATCLAQGPRIHVEAWHKERFKSDTLLGAASIPLAPLLQESLIDAHAPVYALLVPNSADEAAEEKIQIGLLRAIMSLQELGPSDPPPSPPAHYPSPGRNPVSAASSPARSPAMRRLDHHNSPRPHTPYETSPGDARPGSSGPQLVPTDAAAGRAEELAPRESGAQAEPGGVLRESESSGGYERQQAAPAADAPSTAAPQRGTTEGPASASHTAAMQGRVPESSTPAELSAAREARAREEEQHQRAALERERELSERLKAVEKEIGERLAGAEKQVAERRTACDLELAERRRLAGIELELWRKAEEARWRDELREREMARMAALEAEWRRREAARQAEAAALRSEFNALEARAREVLVAAEQREKRVIEAEEGVERRRRELESQQAATLAQAQASVRRLQADLEHQVGLAMERAAEAARLRAAAESRAETAERALKEAREAAAATPAAEVARQLAEAKAEAAAAGQRAAAALAAKQGYKEQVVKLAQELAALQRVRAAEAAAVHAAAQRQQAEAAERAAAGDAAAAAGQQRQQLSALRAHLAALRQGASNGIPVVVAAQATPPLTANSTPTLRAQSPPAQPIHASPSGPQPPQKTLTSNLGLGGTSAPSGPSGKENETSASGGNGGLRETQQGAESEAARLSRERDELLQTGVYTREDALIKEMDARIQELGGGAGVY